MAVEETAGEAIMEMAVIEVRVVMAEEGFKIVGIISLWLIIWPGIISKGIAVTGLL